MAKITALPLEETPDGTETIVLVKGGATKRATLADLVEPAVKPWAERAEDAAAELENVKQGVGGTAFSIDALILSTGVSSPSADFKRTDFIRVEGGLDYSATAFVHGSAWHAWYDTNQVFISAFRTASSTALATEVFTAPATARFARLCTTAGTAAQAKFKPASGRLSIDQVRDITNQFPPTVPASLVPYGSGTAKAQLDSNVLAISQLQNAMADMRNELDETTDATAPVFVPITPFTKAISTVSAATPVEIVSRDTDSTFTVASGQGAKFSATGSCIIFDGERHHSFAIKSKSGDAITVFGELPDECEVAETMHEAAEGQHLGRLASLALPEYLAGYPRRTAYKKAKRLFRFWPPVCASKAFNNPNIYDLTATNVLVAVTPLGGAVGGGFAAGTTDLVKACTPSTSNFGITANTASHYLSKAYGVVDGVAGRGIEFSFAAGGVDGFVEIPISALRVPYNSNALVTEGRVRLEVIADGVTIHDVTRDAGLLYIERASFTRANSITVRMTLADSVPSSLRMYGCNAWAKSPDTPMEMFSDGDVVAFLGDSWTQWPPAKSGETALQRPDGSTADGLCWLSTHLEEYLAGQGIEIETLNYGKGGTTSAWGAHWVNTIINASPKPNKCVLNFGINDNNSMAAPTSTAYDFDPANMWAFKTVANGGLPGAVTASQYAANMRAICKKLSAAGIQPIVLLPPHTGSGSQTQSLMNTLAPLVADGFEG